MRILVAGAGAVGARAARQLLPAEVVHDLVVVDPHATRATGVAASLGPPARAGTWDDLPGSAVVVLAFPGPHRLLAEQALAAGASVVSVADDIATVRSLLDLDAEARERDRSVVVGAGFSPGLTCLLARHAGASLDEVDEVHVARFGTGGPACARTHHEALGAAAVDWRDGAWRRRPGGSGRELVWFPDPVGARDCYRAGLPDAFVVVPAFPGVRRVTARVAASRRDRLTARLPMLRPPHPEGVLGAARVEVRGRRGSARDTRVLGVVERPAMAAGIVAAVTALAAARRETPAGAAGLAALFPDPVPVLQELARRGVRAAVFEGAALEQPGELRRT